MNKEEIIKIRKKLKLNQTEFGKKLGVSYQTVSNSTNYSLNFELLTKIASSL